MAYFVSLRAVSERGEVPALACGLLRNFLPVWAEYFAASRREGVPPGIGTGALSHEADAAITHASTDAAGVGRIGDTAVAAAAGITSVRTSHFRLDLEHGGYAGGLGRIAGNPGFCTGDQRTPIWPPILAAIGSPTGTPVGDSFLLGKENGIRSAILDRSRVFHYSLAATG